jgi:hypothetical protein
VPKDAQQLPSSLPKARAQLPEAHRAARFWLPGWRSAERAQKFLVDPGDCLIPYGIRMEFYSTREAAKSIGVSLITLKRYIAAKKIPLPPPRVRGVRVRLWTERDIQTVRKLLPKIANGRKTRYKKQSALGNQQSAKTKAPARARVPNKERKPKKKK